MVQGSGLKAFNVRLQQKSSGLARFTAHTLAVTLNRTCGAMAANPGHGSSFLGSPSWILNKKIGQAKKRNYNED